jgi:hypothetical protein
MESNATADAKPVPSRRAGMPRKLSVVILSVALAWAWYGHFWPTFHTANESIRLYFVQAVVDEGRPELDGLVQRHGSKPIDRSELGGHVYMDKAPGASLLALPVYPLLKSLRPGVVRQDFWLLGWLSTLWAVALPLLGALWLLAQWLRSIGTSDRDAALCVLALAFASPVFVYATLFFGHGLATACIAIAVFAIAAVEPARMAGWRGGLVGLALGFGGLTDTPVFVLAGLVCVWILVRARALGDGWQLRERLQRAGPTLLGVAFGAMAQLVYNTWVMGEPLRFTYQHKGDPVLAGIMATGFLGFHGPQADALYGLLLGAQRGLFYHAPWLAVGAAGLGMAALQRDRPVRQRQDAAAMLALSVAYILLVSGFADWPAGDCVGARHLLPIVPLLASGLIFVWRWPRLPRIGRSALAATILIGVAMHLPTVASFPYHFAKIDLPALELSWPLVVQGYFSPSVGRLLGWSDWLSFAVFVGLVALPWLLRLRLPHPDTRPHGRGMEMAVAGVLLAAWAIVAISAVPAPRRKVQVLRFKAQSLLGPRADERDGNLPWQRAGKVDE